MRGDVQLRPATVEDSGAIAEIHLASRASAAMPPPIHPPHEVRAWLAERLQSEDEVWLAELDGEPVAYARFTPTWLDDLYVHPSCAGRGIGGAMLDLVKARRPDGFCLWVFEMNSKARRFYAQRGLVELERTDGRANEERSPDIRMAWPGGDGLAFLRRLIDECDAELGDLLARRAALTRAVHLAKGGSAPRDVAREAEIVSAVAARAPALGEDRVARIVRLIITESLDAAAESLAPQATVCTGGSRGPAAWGVPAEGGTADR